MKKYTHINDIDHLPSWIKEAKALKKNPLQNQELGKNKTLGLLFFNPSLRTRLSTQKAALNLGMNPIVMNISEDAWGIEFGDKTVMNGSTAEHIKEAAAVVSQYCDVIAVRAFPSLTDKEKDESEQVLTAFLKYATVPLINMESATGHPLQGLTDAITISEIHYVSKLRYCLNVLPTDTGGDIDLAPDRDEEREDQNDLSADLHDFVDDKYITGFVLSVGARLTACVFDLGSRTLAACVGGGFDVAAGRGRCCGAGATVR